MEARSAKVQIDNPLTIWRKKLEGLYKTAKSGKQRRALEVNETEGGDVIQM